tara:strand:- start:2064 stop:4538 length:2475 start_codon:yes stop_codon:yes gene_type:complete
MPRELLEINTFEKGENHSTDPSDLMEGEGAELRGLDVSNIGRVVTSGEINTTANPTNHPDFGSSTSQGEGLFVFGTEHDDFEQTAAEATSVGFTGGATAITCASSARIFIGCKIMHPVYFYSGEHYVTAITAGTAGVNVTGFTINTGSDTGSGTISGQTISVGAVTTNKHYIAGFDKTNSQVDITDNTNDSAGTNTANVIDIGNGSAPKPVMSYDNGAFKIADGNFTNAQTGNSKSKWRGYVEQIWFQGTNVGYGANGWYTQDDEIHSPEKYDGSSTGNTRLYKTTLANLTGLTWGDGDIRVSLFEEAGNITNSLWEGTWHVAVSYLYEDNQESLLYYLSSDANPNTGVVIGNDKKVTVQVGIGCGTVGGTSSVAFNKRIRSVKVYAQKEGSVGFGTRNWYLLGTFDIATGGRDTHADTQGAIWGEISGASSSKFVVCDGGDIDDPSLVSTYEAETGHLSENPSTGLPFTSLGMPYKTRVVANRIAYIGNVFMEGRHYADRMIKSPVNQLSKYPVHRYLDVVKEDGEEITALAVFNDRLIQFKNDTVYIINVSEDSEFLESTYKGLGVWSQAAVCTSDYGIFWVNENGCYYYDSQKISNVLEFEGKSRYSTAGWASAMNKPMCQFSPHNRVLYVVDKSGGTAPDIYMFNVKLQSWSRGTDGTHNLDRSNSYEKTNMVLALGTQDSRIMIGSNNELFTILATTGKEQNNGLWKSKAFDFGQKGQRKKIKSISIIHKNAGSDKVYPWVRCISKESATWSGWQRLDAMADYSDYTRQEFTNYYTLSLANVYLLQIMVQGNDGTSAKDIPSDFELGSISISFKRKTIK